MEPTDNDRTPEGPEDRFDSLARRAGAAYRKDAPMEGVAALKQRHDSQRRVRTAAIGGAACIALLVGGIALSNRGDGDATSPANSVVDETPSSGESQAPTTTPPTTNVAVTTTAPPSTTVAPVEVSEALRTFVAYTGSELGVAEGTPVKVGWSNDERRACCGGICQREPRRHRRTADRTRRVRGGR
jgi:hypothetical protein